MRKDIVEVRKRLVKALSVADETYNKWTRNVREEYDKEIQSQIISEYLKAELTKQDVQEKFGIEDNAKINRILDETLKKVNLLLSGNHLELFDSYPETLKNKFLKEYTTEDEEVKAMLLSKTKGIATKGVCGCTTYTHDAINSNHNFPHESLLYRVVIYPFFL